MGANLGFRLDDKAQTHRISQAPGNQPQPKRPRVPQRIKQRRARAQVLQPLRRPGQVVGLFYTGGGVVRAQGRVAGGQRLRGVKRLRAHLAHVVDAHQPGGLGFFGIGQRRGRLGQRLAGAGRMRRGKQSTKRRVSGGHDSVGRGLHSQSIQPQT